jgi:hypothetical protein
MTDYLYDWGSDQLIGPATALQIAASDTSIRDGGDGKILINQAGNLCAFGLGVEPGADTRAVFTQPDSASSEPDLTLPAPRTLPGWFTPILSGDVDPSRVHPTVAVPPAPALPGRTVTAQRRIGDHHHRQEGTSHGQPPHRPAVAA